MPNMPHAARGKLNGLKKEKKEKKLCINIQSHCEGRALMSKLEDKVKRGGAINRMESR
jgi:hypothetical protein